MLMSDAMVDMMQEALLQDGLLTEIIEDLEVKLEVAEERNKLLERELLGI